VEEAIENARLPSPTEDVLVRFAAWGRALQPHEVRAAFQRSTVNGMIEETARLTARNPGVDPINLAHWLKSRGHADMAAAVSLR
jgi:hypothetical protein